MRRRYDRYRKSPTATFVLRFHCFSTCAHWIDSSRRYDASDGGCQQRLQQCWCGLVVTVQDSYQLRHAQPSAHRQWQSRNLHATHNHFRKQPNRSEEHTSELQSHLNLVCRLLLEKKKQIPSRETPRPTTAPPRSPSRAAAPGQRTPANRADRKSTGAPTTPPPARATRQTEMTPAAVL